MPRSDLLCGDCVHLMKEMPTSSVDLVVTSPPYDNLRTYNGYSCDFAACAQEISRLLVPGGVVVWIVADATINGSKTGTSFRQALFFRDECGLNLHDTMIWNKGGFTAVGSLVSRYAPVFEYMFIFSKGKPRVFNPIKDRPNKWAGTKMHGTLREADGKLRPISTMGKEIAQFGQRFNIWEIFPQRQRGEVHPAPFPLELARDHIISWSNPEDFVLDPFVGSGTTILAAVQLGRHGVGIDISPAYIEMSNKRIGEYK